MLKLSSGSCMLRLGLRLSIGSCMLRLGLRLRLSFRGSGWPPLPLKLSLSLSPSPSLSMHDPMLSLSPSLSIHELSLSMPEQMLSLSMQILAKTSGSCVGHHPSNLWTKLTSQNFNILTLREFCGGGATWAWGVSPHTPTAAQLRPVGEVNPRRRRFLFRRGY